MGSFTDPGKAPSTLVGVVVAGNIDIRGNSAIDGSIIVTGDGAGNTTLAYFGASDADTNAGANPEGGCTIDFVVDFTFRNPVFEALAGKYLDRAFRKMVTAFEERAARLYGSSSSSAITAA